MLVPLLQNIKALNTNIPMERFYSLVGISRQGYYAAVTRANKENEMIQEIEDQVINHRENIDRRAGSRTLFYTLKIKEKFGIGVNKFERLMSNHGLTLLPLDIRITTTKSSFQSWNYPNLVSGITIRAINTVIVGDLTYIIMGRKRYYLFLLTDLYSFRIVGFCLSNRMRAIDAKEALYQAINLRGKENVINCIHHTDGGSQYFSKSYQEVIFKHKMRISVAENCLENGYAEQRNGLIKNHLIPTIKLGDIDHLKKELTSRIHYYNYERPQKTLNWFSPVEFEKRNENRANCYERKIFQKDE